MPDPQEREQFLVSSLAGCARCGGTHINVEFFKLSRQSFDGEWTHWAPCPANGEPVMMGFREDGKT
jgi:hypothetical protein